MKLTANKGYVLLLPEPKQTETLSGIVLPENIYAPILKGKVAAHGDGVFSTIGSIAYFAKGAEYNIKCDEKDYFVVRTENVLAFASND